MSEQVKHSERMHDHSHITILYGSYFPFPSIALTYRSSWKEKSSNSPLLLWTSVNEWTMVNERLDQE